MNAKQFQELLKESKNILQEGYFNKDEPPGYFDKPSEYFNKSKEDGKKEELSMTNRLNKHRDETDLGKEARRGLGAFDLDDEESAYSKAKQEDASMMDKVIEKIAKLKETLESPEDLYDAVVSALNNVKEYMQSMPVKYDSLGPEEAARRRAEEAAKRKKP